MAARGVAPEDAMAHVRWVTVANDAGVYDLRYADRGSNLRSKGADGFTPVGPVLLDPASLDLADLRLRTWVNGALVQGFDKEAGNQVRVLYGGSLKPDNAVELLAQEDIDGALVGGASLDAESFAAIVEAARA